MNDNTVEGLTKYLELVNSNGKNIKLAQKGTSYNSYLTGGYVTKPRQFRIGDTDATEKPSDYDTSYGRLRRYYQKNKSEMDDDAAEEKLGKICTKQGYKQEIRRKLMQKLNALSQDPCFKDTGLCSEDKLLKKIQDRYVAIMETQNNSLKKLNPDCNIDLPQCMRNFANDKHIVYLQSKIASLAHLNFSFLHRICEEISQECKKSDCIPDNLLDCSGINGDKNQLFFHDPDLAALGRELCTYRERNSNSPARRGFCPDLFMPGTLCQGSDGLYVNVCVPHKESEDSTTITRMMRWTPCNLLEIAAYETAKSIRQRITQRKRQLLQVAREMLKLQSRMYTLHPVTLGERKLRKCAMPIGGNVEHVIDLGLKRMRAGVQQRACQEEIRGIQARLNDESQIMCNRPYKPFNEKQKSRSRSNRRKSKSRSKGRSNRRSKSKR